MTIAFSIATLGVWLAMWQQALARPSRNPHGKPAYGLRVRIIIEWMSTFSLALSLPTLALYLFYAFALGSHDERAQDIACNFMYFPPIMLFFFMYLIVVISVSSWLMAPSATAKLVKHMVAAANLTGSSSVLVFPARRGAIVDGLGRALKDMQQDGASVIGCDMWDGHDREWALENCQRAGVADVVTVHQPPVSLRHPLPFLSGQMHLVLLPFFVSTLGTFAEDVVDKVARGDMLLREFHRLLHADGMLAIVALESDTETLVEALMHTQLYTDIQVGTERFKFSLIPCLIVQARPLAIRRSSTGLREIASMSSSSHAVSASGLLATASKPRPVSHVLVISVAMLMDLALFLYANYAMYHWWPSFAVPKSQQFSVNCVALITGVVETIPIAMYFHWILLRSQLQAENVTTLGLVRSFAVAFVEMLLGLSVYQIPFWLVPLAVAIVLTNRISQLSITFVNIALNLLILYLSLRYGSDLARCCCRKKKTLQDVEERQPLIQ